MLTWFGLSIVSSGNMLGGAATPLAVKTHDVFPRLISEKIVPLFAEQSGFVTSLGDSHHSSVRVMSIYMYVYM